MRLFSLALLLVGWCGAAGAQDQSFSQWRDHFRAAALAAGIGAATFDSAMAGVEPIPHVIELDHRQPESKLAFSDYVRRLASADRRDGVRKQLVDNRALLARVGRRYGVQPRFIVALWGIETDFGRFPGDFPVIASLATLAYDGRRADLFTHELIAALRIVQQDGVPPSELRGSWAGAMGQCQFMPSSFLHYAVSFRGGRHPDIWTDRADVFASIANYLAHLGWSADENWGRMVKAPSRIPMSAVGLGVSKSLAQWRRLGVKRADGGPLPLASIKASLLLPEGEGGPALLVYRNFRTLLHWNNSQAFATSVGLLADGGETR
ncbi:MAG TPA: lytic murein transglycosylase [Stellaceae bacterium]|nr:lytic murein transglycosylase [Stellaceae bacterium]